MGYISFICLKAPSWVNFDQIVHNTRNRGHNHLWHCF